MIKRLIKGFSIITLLLFVIILVMLLWLARPLENTLEDVNALNPNRLIAHAGGANDGYIYTNSKEALASALDNGFRYVELDLYETSDSNVVCLHIQVYSLLLKHLLQHLYLLHILNTYSKLILILVDVLP